MHEQLILFGAPGTGKSYRLKEYLDGYGDDKKFRVTIHPEFLYTDFVGQLLPDTTPGAPASFVFQEGPFTRALMEAYADSSKDVFLILEELSRGNVAAIFGDLFQLLDRDDHFESRYPVRNKNIADKIPTLTTDEIKLPSNFNILCTVNMNDQNVYPMDTAFKRRFDWEYVSTEPVIDKATGTRDSHLNNPKVKIAVDKNRAHDLETTWQSFYMALNAFITDKEKGMGKREDKQVGQFFLDFAEQVVLDSHSTIVSAADAANEKINKMIKNKLLLYLWQDVQGIAVMGAETSLFDKEINSYDDLYKKFGTDKVFSDAFIEHFLSPGLSSYPY
ncbi:MULTISPECIES: AAA family ATPase [Lachnospiraceae]|jgi:5-methylcytosine-specific restriction protein B|uniref:AAA family ATPase n=1 Tax=Faecalicatena acetigenes TaxID=2981790 RepID=A0ABT2TBC2_9FIRM|nr:MULTISPECIES: AAA family ATPase [Lachnospiraceae]MCU6747177.1 AAA family ATPase [Faecalicatena acetigenes]SCH69792.1 5-methylcytosine-specific restriction enzyme B [uncultured Clostridium sp.]